MADKNIQMKQRNATNTDWDDLHPKTKAENVTLQNSNNLEEEIIQINETIANIDLSAENIRTSNNSNVQEEIDVLKSSFDNGKHKVAAAIVEVDSSKDTTGSDEFSKLAEDIRGIKKTITGATFEELIGKEARDFETVYSNSSVYTVLIDNDDHVCFGGADDFLSKMDANGNILWESAVSTNSYYELSFYPNGDLLVGLSSSIARVNGVTGEVVWTEGAPGSVRGAGVYHADESAFILSDTNPEKFYKVDAAGNIVFERSLVSGSQRGLVVDQSGYVYHGARNILTKVQVDGGMFWEYIESENSIYDVSLIEKDIIFIHGNHVVRVDADNQLVFDQIVGDTTLRAIGVDREHHIYVGGAGEIHKLNSDGVYQDWTFQNYTSSPYKFVFDSQDNLWGAMVDLLKIPTNPFPLTMIESFDEHYNVSAGTDDIQEIVTDKQGNAYVCDLTGWVKSVDASGNPRWSHLYSSTHAARTVALDVTEQVLYVGGDSSTEVKRLNAVDGSLIESHSSVSGGDVHSIAVDKRGKVYIADSGSTERIILYNPDLSVILSSDSTHTGIITSVAPSSSSFYSVGEDGLLVKYGQHDGDADYTYNINTKEMSVATNPMTGRVHAGGTNNKLSTFSGSSSAVKEWEHLFDSDVDGIETDRYGNVFAVSNKTLAKFTSDGALVWTYTLSHTSRDLSIGKSGEVYCAMRYSSTNDRLVKIVQSVTITI
ncbi:hypothetical protein VQL36_04885 [Chengkuizengella sp. SCS-71B]|uniref:hypothetical protein n=1 Tax=Chengkuizengella sp. SCS-71B TaxID=3115290 RepID=UPI0032C22D9E